MAYRWFPENERAVAISLVTLGNPIGSILGMVIGPLFIQETSSSPFPVQKEIDQVHEYIRWHAIVDTVLCIPLLFIFRERPQNYPSKGAESENISMYSMKKDFERLRSNTSFWCFLVNFAIIHGVYAALGAVVNNIVRPFKYTAQESSLFGCSALITGLIASFIGQRLVSFSTMPHQCMMILVMRVLIGEEDQALISTLERMQLYALEIG